MLNTHLRQTIRDTDTQVPQNVRWHAWQWIWAHWFSSRLTLTSKHCVRSSKIIIPVRLCPVFFYSLIRYQYCVLHFWRRKKNILQEEFFAFFLLSRKKIYEPPKSVVCLVRVYCLYGSAKKIILNSSVIRVERIFGCCMWQLLLMLRPEVAAFLVLIAACLHSVDLSLAFHLRLSFASCNSSSFMLREIAAVNCE